MALRYSLSKNAFSLLELIVAISILSIGIVACLQALSFSARATGLSCDITNAVFLAEDKIQEFEFKERQNLISKEPTEIKDKVDKFEWRYTLNLDPDLNLYRLNFNITWHRANKEEGLNLVTNLR